MYFVGRAIIFCIRLYQKTLSPDHGPLGKFRILGCCRYRPTCSQYTIDSIQKKGVTKGLILASYRIIRCNPFSKGGWDPA